MLSGDDVGGELVLEVGDAVLEDELALLQSLDLELVAGDHPQQRLDGAVEVAVLFLQAGELGLELNDFLIAQLRRHPGSAVPLRGVGVRPWTMRPGARRGKRGACDSW